MPNPDQYRQMAADCLRAAESMVDAEAKASMLDMARGWQALANQADRNSKLDLVYETPPPMTSPTTEQEQPVVLQRQQTQPKKED
jgi:hypothetical protein